MRRSQVSLTCTADCIDTNRNSPSLAVLELQIVTALFFRYFDAKVDSSMNPDDMIMKVIFSGSPIGEKVLLNLSKDLS